MIKLTDRFFSSSFETVPACSDGPHQPYGTVRNRLDVEILNIEYIITTVEVFKTTSSFFQTLPPNWIGMCSWKVKENGQNSFYLTRVRVQSFAEIGSGFTL